jgi:multidrug resistance protein MdtO
MVLLGCIIAAAGQLFLWPEDAEVLLNSALQERLAEVEELLATVRDGRQAGTAQVGSLSFCSLSRQLELLDDAEARHPSLRHRHVEQLAFIGGVDQLFTAAVAFASESYVHSVGPSSGLRKRVAELILRCSQLRHSLDKREPFERFNNSPSVPTDADLIEAGAAESLPGLVELERVLSTLPGLTGFLAPRRPQAVPPVQLQFDSPSRAAFLTPAFSLRNTNEIVFSLRVGLCAALAYIIYEGLAWPGLETSVLTTIIVAQSTRGASTQKALLRVAGAVMGGVVAILTILCLMPVMESLTPLLVVVAAVASLAAWIATGSQRIAYVGLQIIMAFDIAILSEVGTTTDLVPPRDRVFGVLLGIIVSFLVFELTGRVHAVMAMRRSLASSLRSLAALARAGLHEEPSPATFDAARGWRWDVYKNLTAMLQLEDESKFEWGAGPSPAERAHLARLGAEARSVFITLLALVNHRLSVSLAAVPAALRTELQGFARGLANQFNALAHRIEGNPEPFVALTPLFERVKAAARAASPSPDESQFAHLPGRLALYEDLLLQMDQLQRDAANPA